MNKVAALFDNTMHTKDSNKQIYSVLVRAKHVFVAL